MNSIHCFQRSLLIIDFKAMKELKQLKQLILGKKKNGKKKMKIRKNNEMK